MYAPTRQKPNAKGKKLCTPTPTRQKPRATGKKSCTRIPTRKPSKVPIIPSKPPISPRPSSPAPIGKCNSTHEAGGKGTTTLLIDLVKKKGTFLVEYYMYGNPDQLYILYEGNRIYDTKTLVQYGGSANVTYSGTTSIISVVIYAPNDGTEWTVDIYCPV
jgi:hypothetical protein